MKVSRNKSVISLTLLSFALLTLGFVGLSQRKDKVTAISKVQQPEAKEQRYTCSMHPQIRRHKPGDCPICGMKLIPVGAASSTASSPLEMTPDAKALASVETHTVGFSQASGQLWLNGQLKRDETGLSVQAAQFAGRLESVNFRSGDSIQAGHRIATIYAPELITAQRELLEAAQGSLSYPGLLQALREKMRNWKISDRQIDAVLKRGSVQVNFPILADRSGIATKRRVNPGDWVARGDVLYDRAALDTLWADFDAYENQLAQLRVGDSVEIQVDAFPHRNYRARISFIDPVLNDRKRTVTVRAVLENRAATLKPGMLARAQLARTRRRDQGKALSVPRSAVLWTGKHSLVYVKAHKTGAFVPRRVTLGTDLGTDYQVLSGLKPGESVVVKGAFMLDAAAELAGKPSMINALDHGAHASHKGAAPNHGVVPGIRDSIPTVSQLKAFLTAYLKLKEALVRDDFKASKQAAKGLDKPMEAMARRADWTEALRKASDLPSLRAAFGVLSDYALRLIESSGIQLKGYYRAHCPMAGGDGADWITDEKAIRNPYFGAAMLRCGSIEHAL